MNFIAVVCCWLAISIVAGIAFGTFCQVGRRSATYASTRQPRAQIQWPVTIKTSDGLQEVMTRIISSKGAFMRCRNPLRPHEDFILSIDGPLLHSHITVGAEVVRSNTDSPGDNVMPQGMGVQFVDIAKKKRVFLTCAVMTELAVTVYPLLGRN